MRSLAIIGLLALASCGSGQRMDGNQQARVGKGKDAPATGQRGDPAIIRAMDNIPVSRKGLFQRALACEVKRNAARHRAALVITAAYLTDLDQNLQKDPGLATC